MFRVIYWCLIYNKCEMFPSTQKMTHMIKCIYIPPLMPLIMGAIHLLNIPTQNYQCAVKSNVWNIFHAMKRSFYIMSYTSIVFIHTFKININKHQYYHITLKWVRMAYKYDPWLSIWGCSFNTLYHKCLVEVSGGRWRHVEVFSETRFYS